MSQDHILIKGAREHNLKNIDVVIPREKFVVLTGLSGSGKSTLALDTVFAEGQRRYVESLSAYARQFLGRLDKPDVDYIEGLSPAIAIDQRSAGRNPRSTVGTVTEIHDYLRLLYSRVGRPHCHQCGQPINRQTLEQMVDQVMALPEGTRFQVLAPVVRGRKGEYQKLLSNMARDGFVRAVVDGEPVELGGALPQLDRQKRHDIDVVVDRLVMRPQLENRLSDSMATALGLTGGLVVIEVQQGQRLLLSEHFACLDCGISVDDLAPRMFSFNSPFGACPACDGLGTDREIDPTLVLDSAASIDEGGVRPWARGSYYPQMLAAVAAHAGFATNVPIGELDPRDVDVILNGLNQRIRFRYENTYGRIRDRTVRYEGVMKNLERRYREARSDYVRRELEEYMSFSPCATCGGGRLRPESLAVTIGGLNIAELSAMDVRAAVGFIEDLVMTERERIIAAQVIKEINERLRFLVNVGLDYLSLDRMAGSLSGGEAQRIRLATQIGSGLMGVLYILDEPSIGLHQRDNGRLLTTLKRLRDLGNTLIVVEHDEETIWSADHVLDIGPGAGVHGGEIVAQGSPMEVAACPRSLTGQYLSGQKSIGVPGYRRAAGDSGWIRLVGVRHHNLKSIDVSFPLGTLTCVTGVSGSGKSSLVADVLYPRLAQDLYRSRVRPGEHTEIQGLELVSKVVEIDQSPIGRTPRSNPATYTGVFDLIREIFSRVPESRSRGYKKGRFSFNLKGGRCEACRGDGIIKIEMHFLPDVYVPCEVCKGRRYNRETLEIKYRDSTIADVLDMTVDQALEFFANLPAVQRKLKTIADVGLGYIRLGQPATTLSGGEAQRVKLSSELSRRSNGGTVYILDEPTTGLHFEDIKRLLAVLDRLVTAGDTVIIIEHNLDVIKTADYIIDLGPEGGDAGGEVVATGTPEDIALVAASYTGHYLSRALSDPRIKGAASGDL